MVKQMQRVGKAAKHGLVLKKSGTKDMMYNTESKYINARWGNTTPFYMIVTTILHKTQKQPQGKKGNIV